jgi:hypothetical protein
MTENKMLIAIKLLSELDNGDYSKAIVGSAIEKTKSTAGAIGILELIKFELILNTMDMAMLMKAIKSDLEGTSFRQLLKKE